jgi:MSHA biogenesis protein MshG
MPIFEFSARDVTGKLIRGERAAQSADGLSTQLMREGITPVKIHLKKEKRSFWVSLNQFLESKKITNSELALFTRQMYTLNKAGVPISNAVKHLSKTSRSVRLSDVLLGVAESLESGKNLADSMENYPDIFIPMIIAMVRIGQNTGQLDSAFLRLTQYLEMEGTTVKRIKTALRYPMFVFSTIVVGIIIINIFVIPEFAKVYAKAGVALPKLTQVLIAISDFVKSYFPLFLILFAIIGYFLYRYLKTPGGEYLFHKYQIKFPVIGNLVKRIILLRFAETFAIIVNSGIPVSEGLGLVANSINNQYAYQEILNMQNAIQRGSSIFQAATMCALFGSLELQMLAISEETGELGAMLNEISLYYQREVEYDLKRLIDMMEPILLVCVALMVLLLALAVYMPIWGMVKLVHK